MQLFYTDHFELPLPAEHRFPMSKYRLLRERIASAPWAVGCELLVPAAATDEQLLTVHSPTYVQDVVNGSLPEKAIRRIGFPWSHELVERSRRSTGATIAASQSALTGSISANLAGGTHHAFEDHGEGYCVFNDVAVAARLLQREQPKRVDRILVIDCDVHHGNGTADIFASDPSVRTFSIHGRRNYPLKKPASDVDVALESGTADEEYLQVLSTTLDDLFQDRPDFVFYVAGADPFAGDRLGRLNLTKQGLRRRDELVISRVRQLDIPLAISMAGGYADNVNDIVDIHESTLRTAYNHL